MPVTAPKGRGNRRSGVARGRHGQPGTVSWRDDREVMFRVRLLMRPGVINQPVAVVTDMLNAALEQRGLERVTERTVRNDIDRALTLYQERIVGGADWLRAQYQALLADVWLSIDATPRGKERAPLYADVIHALRDMGRLDGLWNQQPAEVAAGAVYEGQVTNVQELMEAGEITTEELDAYLTVLHRETGGIGARAARKIPALPPGGVIDVEPRPSARPRRALPAAGDGAGPLLPDDVEEDDPLEVVDWSPDEA